MIWYLLPFSALESAWVWYLVYLVGGVIFNIFLLHYIRDFKLILSNIQFNTTKKLDVNVIHSVAVYSCQPGDFYGSKFLQVYQNSWTLGSMSGYVMTWIGFINWNKFSILISLMLGFHYCLLKYHSVVVDIVTRLQAFFNEQHYYRHL